MVLFPLDAQIKIKTKVFGNEGSKWSRELECYHQKKESFQRTLGQREVRKFLASTVGSLFLPSPPSHSCSIVSLTQSVWSTDDNGVRGLGGERAELWPCILAQKSAVPKLSSCFFPQLKVTDNFKWKQSKCDVAKTSFTHCSPNGALRNVTVVCFNLFLSNDFLKHM